MIALEQALEAYAQNLEPLPVETIPIAAALGRVLAGAVAAAVDLPRFDQSAMDGYALRSADTAAASPAAPRRLRIAAASYAGDAPALAARAPGNALRVFTGAPVPPGADSVIPQERVRREGDELILTAPWPANRNIRRRGEELRAGSAVAPAGRRVTPGLLAALINAGAEHLAVRRVPRLRVLVSGDEVRPAGTPLAPGQIPDSNGPLIRAVLQRWGHDVPPIEYLADREEATRTALGQALDQADLVITSGGASVGEHDFLPAAAEALGVRRVFWKVAQKPAKPLLFGVREGKALMVLPGNPGAVLIGLCLHVRRVLEVLEGVPDPGPQWFSGRLDGSVERDAQRVRLLRMRLDHGEDGRACLHPLPRQDSHMLSNLALASVLAWVPAGEGECAAGTILRWTPLPG